MTAKKTALTNAATQTRDTAVVTAGKKVMLTPTEEQVAKMFEMLAVVDHNVVRYVSAAGTKEEKDKRADKMTKALLEVAQLASEDKCGAGCYWDQIRGVCICP